MAIDPAFLAQLRHQYRAELVLLLVQLEQVAPGWWESLSDLGQQIGIDRANLHKSLRKLEKQSLIARASYLNGAGTWIWWVKRHSSDAPTNKIEPCWMLRDHKLHKTERITLTANRQWAEERGIPPSTLRSFLLGRQHRLRQRWTLQSTPMDSL